MIAHKGSSLLSTPFLCVLSIYCPKSHLFYVEEEGSGENSWTQDVIFVFKDSDGNIVGKKNCYGRPIIKKYHMSAKENKKIWSIQKYSLTASQKGLWY